MGQAFRDERSALAAYNADQFFRSYWKTNVVEATNDPFFSALDQPAPDMPRCLPHEASYPVVVDPMGYLARAGQQNQNWLGDTPTLNQNWLGDTPTLTRIPRCNLQIVGNNPLAALALCSLRDGVVTDDNGNPTPDRELRYNFLWVVQRPTNANRYYANLTVVVFDRRAHMYAPPGSEQVFPGINFAPGQTRLVLPVPRNQVEIRSGDWVMDATVYDPTSGITLGRPGMRHAHFYRVSAITETPGGTQLEVQPPLRIPADGDPTPYTGTLVLMRGVSGVFIRSPLTGN